MNATILIGAPGSGKSQYVLNHKKENDVLISADAVIERTAEETGIPYTELFDKMADEATEKADALFERAIEEGKDIIDDRTNCNPRKLLYKINWLQMKRYKVKLILFNTDIEVLKDRNEERKKRGRHIPEKFIKQCHGFVVKVLSNRSKFHKIADEFIIIDGA